MNMTRHNNPWGFFNQIQRELNNSGSNKAEFENHDWAPAVDVRESDKNYALLVDVPGIDPKEIDVSMEKGVLAIKGKREKNETIEGENFKRVERSYGSFARYFDLPDSVDSENIEATANNGVLTITIPKQDAVVSRRKEVKH